MKTINIFNKSVYIVVAILITMLLILYSTTTQSRLSDSDNRAQRSERVQSQRQPSQTGKTSPDVAKTYKPMKNVSAPTGLNSDTRYREMMERDKEERSE